VMTAAASVNPSHIVCDADKKMPSIEATVSANAMSTLTALAAAAISTSAKAGEKEAEIPAAVACNVLDNAASCVVKLALKFVAELAAALSNCAKSASDFFKSKEIVSIIFCPFLNIFLGVDFLFFLSIVYAIGVIGLGFFSVYGIVNGETGVGTVVAFFIVWILAGAGLLARRSLKLKLKTLPEQTTHAKVFGKTTKTAGGEYVAGNDGSATGCYTTPVTTSHFVSFEFDGRRENFAVDVSLYNLLKENDTGTLTYKEYENDLMFIDFEPVE